jgi:hypothetical protein
MNNKLITKEFKDIYRTMINELLSAHGLTNQCTLYYQNSMIEYCDNCLFDPVTRVSSNIYNSVGPRSFIDNTICPECMGAGIKNKNSKTKTITLAIIYDTKYFLNFDSRVVNVPVGSIQTICAIKYSHDIMNSSALSIDAIPNAFYERATDVNPVGLGDLDYIFVNWKKQ